MTNTQLTVLSGVVISETSVFSLDELCCACTVKIERVCALVDEGILDPSGERMDEWRFPGESLKRARLAMRLQDELEINLAGVALAIELLEELAQLRGKLRRMERK